MIWLGAVAVLVGLLIGTVGIGGVLLIPALKLLTPLSIQSSMATALVTFVFTGLVATVLFQRRGSIDWRVTTPLCMGGAVFSFIGAWANSKLDAQTLTLVLALLIVFAGIYTLITPSGTRRAVFDSRPRAQRNLLFLVGAVTGFGSGLTGVGGPVLAVPLMLMLGFAPLATIGASQVVQILAAACGSAVNLLHGSIDLKLAAILTVFEITGVCIGVYVAHAVNAKFLRRSAGLLCFVVGTGLLVQGL